MKRIKTTFRNEEIEEFVKLILRVIGLIKGRRMEENW